MGRGDGGQAVRALADRRDLARIEAALRTQADGAGELDWAAQVDSSVIWAHQHAAGARKGGWTPTTQRGSRRSVGHGAG
jgi:hypothetical protein